MSLNRIRIVLVAPSLGGNIGGCARAMKNMGLTRLSLVAPEDFPSEDAVARAAGADDVLEAAQVYATVEDAVADCQIVVGTSARGRRIRWPLLTPHEAAARILTARGDQEIAVLFGRERTGLTNEELDRCQWLINIPTSPDFSSLNLACAVQIIAYELWWAQVRNTDVESPVSDILGEPLASHADVQRFYLHLEQVLVETGFLDPANPRLLMRRLARLFNRVALTANEVNILRGILTSVSEHRNKSNT